MNIRQFIARNRISALVEWTDRNPNAEPDDWHRTANHYRVTLRRYHDGKRSQMTTYYSMGPALTREPMAADVLDSLASESSGYFYADDFEDWANEYGYDPDSRKAERVYRIVGREAKRLQRFLGVDLYETLVNDVERL